MGILLGVKAVSREGENIVDVGRRSNAIRMPPCSEYALSDPPSEVIEAFAVQTVAEEQDTGRGRVNRLDRFIMDDDRLRIWRLFAPICHLDVIISVKHNAAVEQDGSEAAIPHNPTVGRNAHAGNVGGTILIPRIDRETLKRPGNGEINKFFCLFSVKRDYLVFGYVI